jgi:hypothetical protein
VLLVLPLPVPAGGIAARGPDPSQPAYLLEHAARLERVHLGYREPTDAAEWTALADISAPRPSRPRGDHGARQLVRPPRRARDDLPERSWPRSIPERGRPWKELSYGAEVGAGTHMSAIGTSGRGRVRKSSAHGSGLVMRLGRTTGRRALRAVLVRPSAGTSWTVAGEAVGRSPGTSWRAGPPSGAGVANGDSNSCVTAAGPQRGDAEGEREKDDPSDLLGGETGEASHDSGTSVPRGKLRWPGRRR